MHIDGSSTSSGGMGWHRKPPPDIVAITRRQRTLGSACVDDGVRAARW